MKTPITYIIYTRCSTEEQQKGFSHDYQLAGLKGHQKVRDWTFLGTYSDTVSGRTFDREQLNAIYEIYSEARGVLKYMLVYRWDRLGRDVGEAFILIKRFAEIGIEINCPDNWVDHASTSWPIFLSIQFGLAQVESLKIGERTKDGIYAANSAGIFTGKCPPGYVREVSNRIQRNGKREKRLVPDGNAPVVRKIFRLYADGHCTKQDLFRQHSEQLGVKRSAFFAMFANTIYAGYMILKPYRSNPSRRVKCTHEPLISEELYDRIQERGYQEQNPRQFGNKGKLAGQENFFFLKGVLKCHVSGQNLSAYQVRKKSGKTYYYYERVQQNTSRINALDAHRVVDMAIKEMTPDSLFMKDLKREIRVYLKEQSQADEQEIRKLDREIGRLEDRLKKIGEDYADDLIAAADFNELSNRFRIELAKASARRSKLDYSLQEELALRLQVAEVLESISGIYRQADYEQKRRILKALFPEGFSIKNERVRTRRLNSLITSIVTISDNCERLEVLEPLQKAENLVEGGQPDLNRRPLEPQSSALTN